MGIWDKSEALSHPRLTDTFDQDVPFTLIGARQTAPVDLGNDLDPAPVNVLTCRGARQTDAGNWSAYGEAVTLGIISGPISDLLSAAGEDDFPVVVKWTKVKPKDTTRSEATVLVLVSQEVKVR